MPAKALYDIMPGAVRNLCKYDDITDFSIMPW